MTQSPIITLPSAWVQRIRAGEVVGAPADVVRELAENALDAQARHIRVALYRGGIAGLDVEDDGEGIPFGQIGFAFSHYTTSKIASENLLDAPPFLGFRGEALPAIAAAAQCRLRTRPRDQPLAGTCLAGPQGIGPDEHTSGGFGTQFEVGPLFAHLPARARFLRPMRQELAAVLTTVRQLAAVHPQTAWSLSNDTKMVWQAPIEPMQQRARRLLGRHGARAIEIQAERGTLRVWGMLCPPPATGTVLVCVRKRPVRDQGIQQAVAQTMRGRLAAGKMPPLLLWIDDSSDRIDVHVHPSKQEVRFEDPKAVADLVQEALQTALSASGLPVWTDQVQPTLATLTPALGVPRFSLFNAFIVAEAEQGLVVVDQHAADERLWFDALRSARAAGPGFIPLDPPLVMPIPSSACGLLMHWADVLGRLGLTIIPVKEGLQIQTVPVGMPRAAVPDTIEALLESVGKDMEGPLEDVIDATMAKCACQHAVKAGDRLTLEEQTILLRRLEASPTGMTCPHGRPTAMTIHRRELERLFGR